MANLLTDDVDGALYDGTAHNSNNTQIAGSFEDLGPYVISGLAVTIGVGLSVAVALGVAFIGGRVTKSAGFTIGGLTNGATNFLYLLQDGTTTANVSGTQPSLSVLLGKAVTAAGAVSSVDTTRSSGRQTKVRTENLVPGGPGAGNPASIDLSLWGAAAANGVTVFGTLPAGAFPGSFSAPLTLTADDASGSAITEVLLLRHSNSGGVGAAGIGAGLEFDIETATGSTFNTAARIESAASVVTAGAVTADLRLRLADAGTLVTPLLIETKKLTVGQALVATANYGLLNIGDQGFSGGGGAAFVGAAAGTGLAINVGSGDLINAQLAGAQKAQLTNAGRLILAEMLQCGGFQPGYITQASDTTLGATARTWGADASGGTRTLTLPSAAARTGREYVIKKIDATANNVVVATTGGQTIDGAASLTWNTQYQSYTVVSDGSNWLIV